MTPNRCCNRSEKNKGGGKLREGKRYHQTPPQKRFWTPPPMIRFPPPLVHALSFSLEGMGHRPDQSHFLSPPKLVLEGALRSTQYCFPTPPSKIARYFLPPHLQFPNTHYSLRIPPDLLQESLGPFGPEVSRECPRRCPRKWGCQRECPKGCPRPRAPECPKSVPRVSPECPGHLFDTPGTLSGHFGPEGPKRLL